LKTLKALPQDEWLRQETFTGMGLLKDFRGRGHGQTLLEKALAAAREQKLERVELEVYASNLAASFCP
jgi:ribosomal protein S18 acetylase RimI-like enzyme